MTIEKTKFYATRDFTDAGIEKSFKQGDELTSQKGLQNYIAAGVASDKAPKTAKSTDADPAA
jgi:hypothetical protein